MKSFFKMVLACFVAILLTGIASTLFYTCTFIGLVGAMGSTQPCVTKKGDVLSLKINGLINEQDPSMPFSFSLLQGFNLNEQPSLDQLKKAIDVAAQDDNIAGIYLNTDGMAAMPATLQALRHALQDFKTKSGKFIIAYNDSYSTGQYYVASVADSVFINPIGSIEMNGLSSTIPYYKGLYDKLGIKMEIFRVGTFKSAVEPVMLEHMSDANRLQTSCYLQSIWDNMQTEIAASRGTTKEYMDSLANAGLGYMLPEELATTGLFDGTRYQSEMHDLFKQIANKKYTAISPKDLAANYDMKNADANDEVAVLYACGEIVSSSDDKADNIYWRDLIKEIQKLRDEDDVKAVVLRVNSPGGSAFASEQIWKALEELKAVKPLVVSMSDYAASGGYYISCNANYIYAEPNTLTGSIGVFGTIPDYSGLATGKLGVNFEEVKTHEYGNINGLRPLTSNEKAKIQRSVEQTYDLFLTRCSEGRHIAKDSIAAIAEGRVWTGSYGVQNGLVDALGGLNDAIGKAAELANLDTEKIKVNSYPSAETSFETLMKSFSDDATIRIADCIMGTDARIFKHIKSLKHADRIQARMSEDIVIE